MSVTPNDQPKQPLSQKLATLPPAMLVIMALTVATLLRISLTPIFGSGYTFITFYPATMFATVIAGWRGGLATIAAASLLSVALFISPLTNAEHTTALIVFLIFDGFMIVIADGAGRARRRAELQTELALARKEALRNEIIAHKKVEEALRTSEAKLAGIVSLAMDAIITLDENQRIVLFNAAAEKMFGLPSESACGGSLNRLIPKRYHHTHPTHMRRFSETGSTSRSMGALGEVTGRRANGEEFPIEASISHMTVAGRNLYTVVLRDISERKSSQAMLSWSAQRDELLAQTAARLLESEDPQRLVEELCRQVMTFLDCHVFFNFVADRGTGRLRLNACAGISKAEASTIEWLDYGVAVCGCVARDHERIVAEDIQNTTELRTELVKSYGVQAYCCHPLLIQKQLIGTLSFGSRTRPQFSQEEIAVMKAVASLVAIAMHRIKSEQALRTSEQHLKSVTDNTSVGLATLNRARQYIFINPAYVQILGLTQSIDDLLKCGPAEALPSVYATQIAPRLDRAYAGEKVTYELTRPSALEGEFKYYTVVYEPISSGDEIDEVTVVIFDITERKRAEEGLREHQQRLRLATEASKVGLWEWHVATNTIRWDAQMFRIYGLPPTSDGMVEYSTWSMAVLPEDLPEQERVLQDTMRRAGTSERAFRILTPGGEVRYIEAVEAVRTDAQGKTEWVVGTNIDVTERKQTENALTQQGQLMELSFEPIIVWDWESGITRWNRGCEELYGYSRQEAFGKETHKVLQTQFPIPFDAYKDELLSEGVWAGELIHLAKDGHQVIVESRHQLSLINGRRLVLETNRDITEQKRIKEELEQRTCHERQRAEELQTLFDIAPVGIAISLDPEGKHIQGNRANERMLGLAPGAELSKASSQAPPYRLFQEDRELNVTELPMQRAVRGEVVTEQIMDVQCADGKRRTLFANAMPLFDEAGKPRGAVGAFLDITALKQAEAALI